MAIKFPPLSCIISQAQDKNTHVRGVRIREPRPSTQVFNKTGVNSQFLLLLFAAVIGGGKFSRSRDHFSETNLLRSRCTVLKVSLCDASADSTP